jgi:hypothetical protein
MAWFEERCCQGTDRTATGRWARKSVGPVLAAALGAAVWRHDEVDNPGVALRIFGVVGDHVLSPAEAWAVMLPYLTMQTLDEATLEGIRSHAGLQLLKLPDAPTPTDVLLALTQRRSRDFPEEVAYWLSEYFREHANDDTPYGATYRAALAECQAANLRGELHHLAAPSQLGDCPSREDWDDLIAGRISARSLEQRAGYVVTKQFLLEYVLSARADLPGGEDKVTA